MSDSEPMNLTIDFSDVSLLHFLLFLGAKSRSSFSFSLPLSSYLIIFTLSYGSNLCEATEKQKIVLFYNIRLPTWSHGSDDI